MGYINASKVKDFNLGKIEAALNIHNVLPEDGGIDFIPQSSNGKFAPTVKIVGKHAVNFDKKLYKQIFSSSNVDQKWDGDDDDDDEDEDLLPQEDEEDDDDTDY